MDGYSDSATDLVPITEVEDPADATPQLVYRAIFVDTAGTYKLYLASKRAVEIPLQEGMNPIAFRGVYDDPVPAGNVWGVP